MECWDTSEGTESSSSCLKGGILEFSQLCFLSLGLRHCKSLGSRGTKALPKSQGQWPWCRSRVCPASHHIPQAPGALCSCLVEKTSPESCKSHIPGVTGGDSSASCRAQAALHSLDRLESSSCPFLAAPSPSSLSQSHLSFLQGQVSVFAAAGTSSSSARTTVGHPWEPPPHSG